MEGVMNTAIPRIRPDSLGLELTRGRVEAAEIRLGGARRGVVIVAPDAGELDRDAADVMNGLAGHGYASIAVDLSVSNPTDDELVADIGALLAKLDDDDWSREQVGVIGYGFGGRIALLAAMAFDLGAAVSVSPVTTGTGVGPMRTPWLGLFGDNAQAVAKLRADLDASAVYVSTVTYPAGGDFYRDSGNVAVHAAAFDSWQRTVEWLNLRVAPATTPER
jgi:carboxymethylenebutenolidase